MQAASPDAIARDMPEPWSGYTHAMGALLAAVGWIVLLAAAWREGTTVHLVAYGVYGATLLAMYVASTVYHLVPGSTAERRRLKRIDHVAIFCLIAGSYTPLCLLPLHGPTGLRLLAVVWSLALAGAVFKLFWLHSPRWISVVLYVGMGWLAVFAAGPLARTLSTPGLVLLGGGGVVYTVGALVYAFKWPDPWPDRFGFHEVWHLFVIAGSACHWALMLSLV